MEYKMKVLKKLDEIGTFSIQTGEAVVMLELGIYDGTAGKYFLNLISNKDVVMASDPYSLRDRIRYKGIAFRVSKPNLRLNYYKQEKAKEMKIKRETGSVNKRNWTIGEIEIKNMEGGYYFFRPRSKRPRNFRVENVQTLSGETRVFIWAPRPNNAYRDEHIVRVREFIPETGRVCFFVDGYCFHEEAERNRFFDAVRRGEA